MKHENTKEGVIFTWNALSFLMLLVSFKVERLLSNFEKYSFLFNKQIIILKLSLFQNNSFISSFCALILSTNLKTDQPN